MELVTLKGSGRGEPKGRKIADQVNPDAKHTVTITVRPKEEMPAEIDPTKTMSLSEIEARHGARPEDLDLVQKTLGEYGLKTVEVSAGARTIEMSGTVAQMQAAFGVKLSEYESEEYGRFIGREGEVKIPLNLSGIVTGVFGLDTRRVARHRTAAATAVENGLMPDQLAQMYGFTTRSAAGQMVGILEFAGAVVNDDLVQFCQAVNVPVPQVDIVGPQGDPNDDATGEVMMDVQIVAAMAQGANITVYFSDFSQKGWIDQMTRVIHGHGPKPNVISISYGVAERSGDFSEAGMNQIDGFFQEAAQMGITICVSSGDDGCGSLLFDGSYNANFPASSPNVLAVGGTMLHGENEEVTWWQSPGRRFDSSFNRVGGGATGGGFSAIFAKPSWQTVTPTAPHGAADRGRIVPDVAALAGPPFYFLILNGETAPNGGTSASAPLWASAIACLRAAGKGLGFLPPKLYAADGQSTVGANVCRDITKGSNHSDPPRVGFQAGQGFDAVTGWGALNLDAMLKHPSM